MPFNLAIGFREDLADPEYMQHPDRGRHMIDISPGEKQERNIAQDHQWSFQLVVCSNLTCHKRLANPVTFGFWEGY